MVREMAVAIHSQLEHLAVNAPDWCVSFYYENTSCGLCSEHGVLEEPGSHLA